MKEKIILGFILSLLLCVSFVSAGVVINEILPNVGTTDWDNSGGVSESGDEWVELYNDDSVAQDISDWQISDEDSNMYTFPTSTILGADSYIIVFDLSLSNSGDNVTLYDDSSNVVDYYAWTSNPNDDESIGREYDGSDDWITFTTPTPNASNGKLPVADAGQNQTVGVDTEVTLNGSGSDDPDGTIDSYNWTQESGASVTITGADKAIAKFTPATVGNYTFKLTVTDNDGLSDDDNIVITVEETPPSPPGPAGNLTISDLDVRVGGEKEKNLEDGDKIGEEARPGDKIKFDIEIENTFSSSSDIEIEDVEVVVTIKDIDDGDDLDWDEDIGDIDAGKDESVTIEFTVPTLVDEGEYDVIIEVDGKENGNDYDVRWELILEVKKDRHALLIDDLDIIPSLIKCDRNPSLEVEVINIGRKDEDDVSIEIRNDDLDVHIEARDIELEEGDTDDSVFEKIYRLRIDDDVKEGIYPITLKAYYDGRLGDEKTVDLIVEKCIEGVIPLGAEPVDVIIEKPTVTKPTPVTKISFRETSGYLTLMIIFFVILAGVVIFLIGATIILLRKR